MSRILTAAAAAILFAASGAAFAQATDDAAAGQPAMRSHGAVGDRYTQVLNTLEAHGYYRFVTLQPQGQDVIATVLKGGQQKQVEVDPLGTVHALG